MSSPNTMRSCERERVRRDLRAHEGAQFAYWADPSQSRRDQINRWVRWPRRLFRRPNGHLLEILTRCYGSAGTSTEISASARGRKLKARQASAGGPRRPRHDQALVFLHAGEALEASLGAGHGPWHFSAVWVSSQGANQDDHRAAGAHVDEAHGGTRPGEHPALAPVAVMMVGHVAVQAAITARRDHRETAFRLTRSSRRRGRHAPGSPRQCRPPPAGLLVSRKRTRLQRQPPSIGSWAIAIGCVPSIRHA